MARSVRLVLPWPPSVNAMWRTPHKGPLAGRTMLSGEGRAYRKAANDAATLQRVLRHALTGKLALSLIARPPDRRRRDLDNLLKGVLDALQHAAIIDDDGEIDDLRIRRGLVTRNGEIEVHISEIPGEATNSRPLNFVSGNAAGAQTEVV